MEELYMKILIPAFEPNMNLIKLINDIKKLCNFEIVIVDDGSGKKYKDVFEIAESKGCTVIKHLVNFGKGCALKTGMKYIQDTEEKEGFVTADSDGQHLAKDIVMIANELKKKKNTLILGERYFEGKIPVKSKFGNKMTRSVFYFLTGQKIFDTQTGLRGFSINMIDWLLKIEGTRFEYEMNILLDISNTEYNLFEMKISTIYHKHHSTHFRAVEDSIRIYIPIIKFSMSSILSALIDYIVLFLVQYLSGILLLSVVLARVISATFNYAFNKKFVFKFNKKMKDYSLLKYFALVIIVLVLNYSLLFIYYEKLGLSLFISKVLTECSVFIFSYWIQKKYVFKFNTKNIKKYKKVA
jgi:putative flippase GtrA